MYPRYSHTTNGHRSTKNGCLKKKDRKWAGTRARGITVNLVSRSECRKCGGTNRHGDILHSGAAAIHRPAMLSREKGGGAEI